MPYSCFHLHNKNYAAPTRSERVFPRPVSFRFRGWKFEFIWLWRRYVVIVYKVADIVRYILECNYVYKAPGKYLPWNWCCKMGVGERWDDFASFGKIFRMKMHELEVEQCWLLNLRSHVLVNITLRSIFRTKVLHFCTHNLKLLWLSGLKQTITNIQTPIALESLPIYGHCFCI